MQTQRNPFRPGLVPGERSLGRLLHSRDWAATPLGAKETWSPALQAVTGILLANRFPMLLWWGPQYTQLYNDAYRPVLGAKHPKALGQPAGECWAGIWHIIGPLIETPFRGGPATWMEDLELEIDRHGYLEETHFTVAYSPVPDPTVPGGIGGVLATVHEISDKIIGARRLVVLRNLGRARTGDTAREACAIAARTLAGHDKDLPFGLIYLAEGDGRQARLSGSFGAEHGTAAPPPVVELKHADASWSDPSRRVVVLPIRLNPDERPLGLFVGGVSATRPLDDDYRVFFELVAGQLATDIANARAREDAQERVEALAELDRAKTRFFSNVSHEFRTPLTLMLGPIEDALGSAGRRLSDQNLEITHRNALRLLRSVNALLEFSRLETGGREAWFEPLQLDIVTRDLAEAFRPALERAGLRFTVECPPLGEPVYVDRNKWEKIVLNLLSNAFKATLAGGISVTLRRVGEGIALTVSDTGTGIAAHELPRLFERFHRIEGAAARSHEGSGIGLALVRELVRLHGADIQVGSELGRGSNFTITLRRGIAHLPPHLVGSSGSNAPATSDAAAFVQEALQWLPSADEPGPPVPAADLRGSAGEARILIVDDSRDMRRFVEGLLGDTWVVRTAGDGEEALAVLGSEEFDVVLADVMMPRLDGFGLLQMIRSSPTLSSISVILLSASAENASRIAGLEAGADDYLVKPFSPGELRARLRTQLDLTRGRRHRIAERDRLHELLSRIPALVSFLSGPNLVFQFAHPETIRRLGGRALLGKPLLEAVPEYRNDPFPAILQEVLSTGESFAATEVTDPLEQRYWNVVYQPVRSASGEVDGVMTFELDVTEQVLTRRKLEEQSCQLEEAVRRAEAADHRKSDFLATVAHELKNPLVPVLNSLEILKRAGAEGIVRDRACDIIERQVHQMKRLVDDLLDLTRISRSEVEFKRTQVELGVLLERVVEAGRPAIEACGQTLTLCPASEVVMVEGDAGRLTQVFANLLTNASKYTERGGVITVGMERQGSDVLVRVSDTGIGIPPSLLERIFERFVQVAPSAEGRGGMGIGLALARQMVELHGGAITAQSPGAGRGSEFTVRLPADTGALVVQAPEAAPEPVAPAMSRRVLVVDDNRDAVESLAMLLALSGYEAETALDGVEAVRIATSWRPDVVLLDIGLPRMNGYEVCRAIRAELWGRNLPVIALTGRGHTDARRLSADAGFTAHLVKPVDIPNLMRVLAQVETQAA